MDTFALVYRNGHDFFYIPTVPEARKWRGPYPTETHMERACCGELGRDVTITWTKIPPSQHP